MLQYVDVRVWRVHMSVCERDLEGLVFGRWLEYARLWAPICFVSLLYECMYVIAVVVIEPHVVYFVNLRDV